jgi:hypothetical protein
MPQPRRERSGNEITASNSALPEKEPVVLWATMIVHDGPPDGNDFGSQHCRNIESEL